MLRPQTCSIVIVCLLIACLVAPSRADQPRDDATIRHDSSDVQTADATETKQLLAQKLAERDKLQQDIERLSAATGTPQDMLIRVKMVEVNLTKLRRLGVDFSEVSRGPVAANDLAAITNFPNLLGALTQNGIAKVLVHTNSIVASGRPASFVEGGQMPVPTARGDSAPANFVKFGTEVNLLATAIGDNKVCVEVRPSVRELDYERGYMVDGKRVPGVTVRQCDFCSNLEFDKPQVISGLVQRRKTASVSGSEEVVETHEVALVCIVTASPVRSERTAHFSPTPATK